MRAKVQNQITPMHDYLDFKMMTGNEILINLQHCSYMTTGEVLNCLLALHKRDRKLEYPWEQHPWFKDAIIKYSSKIFRTSHKHVLMGIQMADKFKLEDERLWRNSARRMCMFLHKFKAGQLAQILDIYSRKKEQDDLSMDYYTKQKERAWPGFIERIVSILPLHIPQMTNAQVVRTFEILVERNIGSDRLFEQYIYLSIEKNVFKYSPELYVRTVRALADKCYYEDPVFWQEYMLKYLNHDRNGNPGIRQFSSSDAKMVWEALAFLKFKVPQVDLKDYVSYVEDQLKERPRFDPDIYNEEFRAKAAKHDGYLAKQRHLKNEKGVLDPELRPTQDMLRPGGFKKTIIASKSQLKKEQAKKAEKKMNK